MRKETQTSRRSQTRCRQYPSSIPLNNHDDGMRGMTFNTIALKHWRHEREKEKKIFDGGKHEKQMKKNRIKQVQNHESPVTRTAG